MKSNNIKTIFSIPNTSFYLIVAILLTITFKDFLSAYPFFTSIKIRGIDDLFNIFLYAIMVVHMFVYRIKLINAKVLLFLITIFCFSLIQMVILARFSVLNTPIPLIRDSLWFIPVYYFVSIASKEYMKKYRWWGLTFISIQVVVFIFQQIYTIVTVQKILFEDNVNGSLGYHMSHILAFTLILFIPLLNERKNRFLTIGAFSIFILASARACMVIAFVSFMFSIIINMKPSRSIPIAFVMLLFAGFVGHIYTTYTKTTMDLNNLIKQQSQPITEKRTIGANRIAFLMDTYDGIDDDFVIYLFGHGIASYASRTAMKAGGHKYKEYEKRFPYKNEYIVSGSTYNVWLGELGVLGTLMMVIFFSLFVIPFRKDAIIFGTILTGFFGLVPLKLMESYAFGFFFWYMAALYQNRYWNSKYVQK